MKNFGIVFFIISFLVSFPFQVKALENITVTKTPIVIKSSRLKENYDGYQVELKNNTSNDLKIKDLILDGSVNSSYAYLRSKKSSGGAVGATWAIGLTFFWVFLIPVAVAILATPVILISNGSKNKKLKKETANFYNSLDEYNTIPANETLKINVLVPKSKEFSVHIETY